VACSRHNLADCHARTLLNCDRFLSALPLPANIARYLFLVQAHTLTHVHLRLEDLDLLEKLDCVRTADLWLPHPEETWSELEEDNFQGSLEHIGRYNDLKRLYLGTKFEMYSDLSRRLAEAFSFLEESYGRLEKLRELSISGIPLGIDTYGLSKIISFPQLTHLTLWACSCSQRFISNLVHELGDQDLSLKHLGLELVDGDEIEDEDDDIAYEEDDDAVEELISRCPELKSLCLQWSDRGWIELTLESFKQILAIVGQQLVVLSIHMLDTRGKLEAGGPSFWKEISLACPNLEQLAFNLDSSIMLNYKGEFGSYLVRLCSI